LTCYIVIAQGHGGSVRYGNRNKLMKNRDNAAIYPDPSSAKRTAGRLLILHTDLRQCVICVYNRDLHPDIMPLLVTRAVNCERWALVD
jgi:hypothetical protein